MHDRNRYCQVSKDWDNAWIMLRKLVHVVVYSYCVSWLWRDAVNYFRSVTAPSASSRSLEYITRPVRHAKEILRYFLVFLRIKT